MKEVFFTFLAICLPVIAFGGVVYMFVHGVYHFVADLRLSRELQHLAKQAAERRRNRPTDAQVPFDPSVAFAEPSDVREPEGIVTLPLDESWYAGPPSRDPTSETPPPEPPLDAELADATDSPNLDHHQLIPTETPIAESVTSPADKELLSQEHPGPLPDVDDPAAGKPVAANPDADAPNDTSFPSDDPEGIGIGLEDYDSSPTSLTESPDSPSAEERETEREVPVARDDVSDQDADVADADMADIGPTDDSGAEDDDWAHRSLD